KFSCGFIIPLSPKYSKGSMLNKTNKPMAGKSATTSLSSVEQDPHPSVAQNKQVDERVFMKSVERTFLVLESFGQAQHPLTLSEIAQLVGIDKSGAQRICYTLQALGYLERAQNGRG